VDSRDNLVSDLIRVTAACDANCPFCNWPHERHRDFVSPTVDDLVALGRDFARNASDKELVLSGGEPLLRQDLEAIVSGLKAAGVATVRMQTNAVALSRDRARSLARAGLDRALISLHSRQAAIHDRLMGHDGAHRAAVAGAQALLEADVALSFNYVLTRVNAEGLAEDLLWLHRRFLGLTHVSLSTVQPHGRAQGRTDLVPRYPEIADRVREALAEADRVGLLVNNPYCGLPICMGWERHVDRCAEASEAGARRAGGRRAPLGLINRGDKDYVPACAGCADRPRCGGVWKEYLRLYGADDIAPTRRVATAGSGAPAGEVPDPGVGDAGRRNIEVNLGKACNNRCVFCANGIISAAERRWTPVRVIKAEVERGFRDGCTSLGFLGGEPMLYPWLEEVVRHARAIGYERVALCTNGTRLAEDGLAERVVDAGVTRLSISIHSHRGAMEDRLTGRRGCFAAKLAGLDEAMRLLGQGRLPHNVALEAVLLKPLLGDLIPYVEFFSARGVVDFRFNTMRPEGASMRDRGLVPRLTAVGDAVTALIIENERRLGLRLLVGDLPLCVLPAPLLVNRALLSRYIGERLDMETQVAVLRPETGEVERFGWSERKRERLKVRMEACERCALSSVCEGPWRNYVDLYGEDEFVAVPG